MSHVLKYSSSGRMKISAGYKPGNTTYGSSAREWKRTAKSVLGGVANGISTGMDGYLDFIINHYWENEPDIPRIATGIEHRVDKLKSLGNAVVPQQFYLIFKAIAKIMQFYSRFQL